jgi:preprotein translocase subunit SecF
MKEELNSKKIDWLKYRVVYIAISVVVIVSGLINLVTNGVLLGVDFTGGALVEYHFDQEISTEVATKKIEDLSISVGSIQKTANSSYLFKLAPIERKQAEQIQETLKKEFGGEVREDRFENVGPSVGSELIKKTIYALVLSTLGILFWIAYQFKSVRFGVAATVATLHDAVVIIGTYSIVSRLYHAEIDFLFVTAVLTILSFSVHDTIIVFDRIREIRRKHGGEMYEVINRAISETMRRSIFNSLAIIFMLISLVVLGGTTTRWFAVALLIGTISGTYSSPFIAGPMLAFFYRKETINKH